MCDVLNTQNCLKTLMSDVHKLLKIYLMILVTTASSERNFSALKRIKTYLRNSTTQSRLNHCMLLYVHKDRTDSSDTKDIALEFSLKIAVLILHILDFFDYIIYNNMYIKNFALPK